MPITYEPIATTTLSTSESSITFNSFSGYTDLILIMDVIASAQGDARLRFNGDTGTTYSWTGLTGQGTTASSVRQSNTTSILLDYFAEYSSTSRSIRMLQIQDYSNTSTYKSFLVRAGNATLGGTDAIVGLWRSTSAITSITIFCSNVSTYSSGSTFTLYGIKAAV